MTDIQELIRQIIPYPADHSHREGFTNEKIIDQLTKVEKSLVEDALINLINDYPWDTLIVETLAYLKSEKSLPILRKLLEKSKDGIDKLSIATSIYDICKDKEMIAIAINEFKQLESIKFYRYENIMTAFYYLSKLNSDETNDLIGKYLDHKNYLVSYNAKRLYKKQK